MLRLAFTLVELLIVVLIISILAVFGIFTYKSFKFSKRYCVLANITFVVKWFASRNATM